MQLSPYLFFNGNCEAAFKFYERVLEGKIEAMMPHAGTPAEKNVSPEWAGKILHASMTVEGQHLMASDAPPDHAEKQGGYSLFLSFTDPAKAERIFQALAEKGQVKMPFQQTFWAYRFGMLVDQFDIPWMINCDKAA